MYIFIYLNLIDESKKGDLVYAVPDIQGLQKDGE